MSKALIILGSSRSDGDTARSVHLLHKMAKVDFINLQDYKISYYDYEHKNKDDDFISLIQSVIEKYDVLVFATPVYWYTMSGIMKVFLDRFSDLLSIEKELGRKLRGKKMAVLSCSLGSPCPKSFFEPFELTAEYLGMDYLGQVHISDSEDSNGLEQFCKHIGS